MKFDEVIVRCKLCIEFLSFDSAACQIPESELLIEAAMFVDVKLHFLGRSFNVDLILL